MTDSLGYVEPTLHESHYEESDSESAESGSSASYEEEDLYSSESEMATQFNSQVQSKANLEAPVSSNHSLVQLFPEQDESRPDSVVSERPGSVVSERGGTPQLSKQELIRQIHLRRHIDQLNKTVEEKQTQLEELRVGLLHCREHLSSLLTRESSLQSKLAELQPSAPSRGLIRAQCERLQTEIAAERNTELNIQDEVARAELMLSEVTVAAGEFEDLELDLVRGEEAAKEVKRRQAVKRLQAESKLIVNAERARKNQERLMVSTLQDQEDQTKLMLEEVRLAQERGKQFLQETLDRRRREEALQEQRHKAHLDKRIRAMISLKNNIESSQSTMQAQQMLKTESAKRRAAEEQREREAILTEGGNPDQVLLRRQRIESFELSREAFLKRQNERQVEIVNRLLEEEKMLKKVEEKLSKSHWRGRQECPHPSKQLSSKKRRRGRQRVQQTVDHEEVPVITDKSTTPSIEGDAPPLSPHNGSPADEGIERPAAGESLSEPEIRGLWERQPGPERRERGDNKMRAAMEKLKNSKVVTQVVAGREFKGQAFISKPAEVVFQDFEVDKTYRKKVALTNVSYSFNYCKLVDVTDNLKDFLSVEFNPPGSMSAGLTCHMIISFEPKVNEDIVGHVEMLSQTGPFTIPVKCLVKRCVISVDQSEVDFSEVCVGETVRRRITLTNTGALPTRFTFTPKPRSTPSVHAPLETDSTVKGSVDQLSDKSAYSVMTTVETSRMDTLTVPGEGKTSRSVGDLSCVSQRSLSWTGLDTEHAQSNKGDVPVNEEINEEESQVNIAPAIMVGGVSEGEIPAFSSQSVELLFSPQSPTEQRSEFILTFSNPTVPPVTVRARGVGLDLPVWLESETMDLRVCALDRLYQDTLVLHNRAPTALRVTFKVPPLLQLHLEVLPKYGVVQGDSSYSAQLKFTPRESILDGSCDQLLSEEGSLVMPVEVQVADQTQPLSFNVLATVTPSELTFNQDSLDFGVCTTHESVVATLELTNTSLLPQSYGFVSLPACVEVQPGDGFGQILPEETLAVDVILNARKPREYLFELTIKTDMDKTYKIPCRGQGVLPPLLLSENAISFPATALNDTSRATIVVHNPRLGRLNSAVIRGAVRPQGPKLFEFVVPPGCPIAVCPQVGEVPLGESVSVQVLFSPKLDKEAVRQESARLAREETVRLELEKQELEQQQLASKKKGKKVDVKKSGLVSASKNSLSSSTSKGSEVSDSTEEPVTPEEGSDVWCQAEHNLMSQFTSSCLEVSIPCFTSSESSPSYRVEDTLYLEVTAPVVRPGLVVEGGSTNINYDSVGTGDAKTKMISIRNISDSVLTLRASALDPHGPFELRNALRDLSPGQSANLIIRFSPGTGGKFCEHLVLTYNTTASLRLKLSGTGVQPQLFHSLDSDTLDLGHTMVGDRVTGTVQLRNSSPLAVRYRVTLDSSLPRAAETRRKKGLPYRAANHSGEPPFACHTCEGVIDGGGDCELTVSFTPDHQSPAYRDTMYIDINSQRTYAIQVKAQSWTNNMYVVLPGGDSVGSTVGPCTDESMAASAPIPDDQTPPPTPLVLLFTHHLDSEESGQEGLKRNSTKSNMNTADSTKITREIHVGCIKTPLVKKAAGELSIEAIPSSVSKHFAISPLKTSVEAGGSRTITVTFTPPRQPSVIEANVNMTLKGDSSQVYRLLLRGLICE